MISDDFAGGLDPAWSFSGPAGTASGSGATTADAYLTLSTPTGDYDVYGTNRGARLLQTVADDDFEVEARFLTTPSQRYQLQGFLVEQDADNWLRFDIYSDGSRLWAYGAITTGGVTAKQFKVAVSGSAEYLELDRTGDTWTFRYSTDGTNWTTAGSFQHAMTVTAVGPMAGSTGGAPGYTARVDYVAFAGDPILDEDPGYVTPNGAPVATDDTLAAVTDTPRQIALSEILGNDSDPDGDALTLQSFTSPAHGTLVNNGDGTLTYTPVAGYSGGDSFSYAVSDGSLSDSATVSLDVGTPPGPGVSDDFAGGLDPAWSFSGPAGTASGSGATTADAYLTLTTPTGDYDVYGTNRGARLLQTVADDDFEVEARFLSTPSQRYQLQGFLVEQDADDWLRFDIYSDGSRLWAYGAITTGGVTAKQFKVAVSGSAEYLELDRSGDTWTFRYSADGTTWTTAGSFQHAITVTAVGPMAGSTGGAPGYTARVDYVAFAGDPILDEDPGYVTPNGAPVAVDDTLAAVTDTPRLIALSEILGNDSDPDGDALTLQSFTSPAHGTLVDNGDGTLTYTPVAGYSGGDSFSYAVSDGSLSDSATVSLDVGTPPGPGVSDDFAGGLDPAWSFSGPAGTASGTGATTADAYLTLTTPTGDYDVYGTNRGARLLQTVADDDFEVEARFLSTPSQRYQLQGFLVEQDADDWLRFDIYSDGSRLWAYGAITTGGVTAKQFKVAVSGSAEYLELDRSGDTWTFRYSADGTTWTTAGSFQHAITVTAVGPMAGSTGGAPGYTARVDYVAFAGDPILDEDPGYVTPNGAPVATDDTLAAVTDTPRLIALSEILGNDSDPDGDALTLQSFTSPAHGTLVDNGDGTLTYTPVAGYSGGDSFSYVVSDGSLSDSATVSLDVGTPPGPGVSDDFAGGLDPAWSFSGPAGTASGTGATTADAYLTLTTPTGDYDVYGTNRGARLLQTVADDDFEVEARFLSTPSQRYQLQGFLVEQDADDWLRFDIYSDGSRLWAYGAITTGGVTAKQFKVAVSGSAEYLELDRTGDTWTFRYSADGTTWTTAGSFQHAMTVTAVGPMAGSTGGAPGYTARVDYVAFASDPILDEDPGYVTVNGAPVAVDDTLGVLTNASRQIALSEILGNDSDPDGDALTLQSFTSPAHGTLVNNGDGTLTYTPVAGYSGGDSFSYVVSDGSLSDTGKVSLNVGAPIDVWYGDVQDFGSPGVAQRWVNILGNVVPDDLVSLSYSLNGGPQQGLSVGPDTRRLQDPGDFNIDLARGQLNGSSVDDVVTIRATYGSGAVYTRDVVVEYQDGVRWPSNYAVDWSTVSNIQDVTQVVDGKWSIVGDGVRTEATGYDRILAFGDQHWDNYTAELSFTVNAMNIGTNPEISGSGVGFGMLWGGHTDNPVSGWQPVSGYNPIVSPFFNVKDNKFILHDHPNWSSPHLDTAPFSFSEGTTYNVIIEVDQTDLINRSYSFKCWEAGTSEPSGWTMQGTDVMTDPVNGSFVMIAHHWDITFHDALFQEIEGDDILIGTAGADVMDGASATSQTPGRGEQDVLKGEAGADLFVFGDSARGAYYDDGAGTSSGKGDYGCIWDFQAGIDQIQLAGSASDYSLTENASGVPSGTAIWLSGLGAEQDELIGVVRQVYGLSLGTDDFIFDGTTIA